MKKSLLFISFTFVLISQLFSQGRGVHGYVYDSTSKTPLGYAHVTLSSIPLSDFPIYTTTNDKGYFEFRRINPGKYVFEITFLGFEKYIDTIQITRGGKNLDTIYLKQSYVSLKEIIVSEKVPLVEQKGDTLVFNASAFRTTPNSTLEDLVLKFPGVEKEENVIKVQGEEIKKVLVDGRRFFGDDPNIALKNLPAEIVEQVQLFDKKSDQAELTGFQDDQTEKAFNVITRVDKRKGYFGRMFGGYGTKDRFNSGLNLNSFNNAERISILGMANNINLSSFSVFDLSSSDQFSTQNRGRGSRYRGPQQSNPLLNLPINVGTGNNDIYAAGVNYSNIFKNKIEISGSYFFNKVKNINNSSTIRKYTSEFSGLDNFNERISSLGNNFDHRINLFVDYRIDTSNILRLRPNFQFTTNSSKVLSFSENYLLNNIFLNSNSFHRSNTAKNYDLSNEFVFSHRFPVQGRTISIGLNTSFAQQISDYDLFSITEISDTSPSRVDSLNQISNYLNKRFNSSISVSYTEPVGTNSYIRIRFNPNYFNERRVRDNYEISSFNSKIAEYDSINSNSFQNQNLSWRSSISYRYSDEKLRLELDLMYQHHIRKRIQKYPVNIEGIYKFNAILPSFELNYRFSETRNLRIEYSTRAQIPSITQLQNTIDFSNPQFLKTGNPDLNKVLVNDLRARFFITNPEAGSFKAYTLNVNFFVDNIGNNVIFLTRDTILYGNVIVNRGTQLSYPVNIGNALSVNTGFLYSFKLETFSSTLALSTDLSYSRSPNLINGKENLTQQFFSGINISLSSNQPNFDYRINYSPRFTYSYNSLNKNISKYLSHNFGLNAKGNIYDELFISNQFNYYFNPRSASNDQKSSIIWNIGTGFRFLNEKRAELKLEVIDVLNQRKQLVRIIREDYYEDRYTQLLERFFILTFTYNLRTFR
ncbi:MAG: outer membrane beta-barrel protein [Ignavibacteria bacterium]